MSASHSHGHVEPKSFAFTPENKAEAEKLIARYPAGRQQSAVMGLLWLAQRQCGGWLPRAAMEHVAETLGMAPIRVYEVATFYTMYNLKPVGQHHIQLCRTTPCWLRGSDALRETCEKKLGIGLKEVTPDGKFSLVEVECLGACVNAPMLQINDDFYEDLDPQRLEAVLDALARGEKPKVGSQTGRQGSAPEGGPTTLLKTGAKAGE
jgi:NADH dehydrogenase (ubiquinone) flavoprotein 2